MNVLDYELRLSFIWYGGSRVSVIFAGGDTTTNNSSTTLYKTLHTTTKKASKSIRILPGETVI